MFNVLFEDKHLSAFDFVLGKPSWTVEFGKVKTENSMLSDSPTAHYPYKKEFWEATRHGYNTQYLPHIFTGKPTPGQGLGIFSTSLFQFFMDVPNALDWSIWLRMLLAGVFMYMLLIQLGVGAAASTLGALAWTYNMHQIAWLMFPHHLATELWIPLLLVVNLCALKMRPCLPAALALVLGLVFFFTSNYSQIILYTLVFMGVFNTLYIVLVQAGSLGEKLKTWCYINAVYLLAGLFLLPEALWQAQELSEGLRSTQDFRFNRYQLDISPGALLQLVKDIFPHPIDAARLFMPNYLSDLGDVPELKQFFKSNSVEFQAYYGLICLYFTNYGLIRGVLGKNRLLIVLAIMLAVSTGLMNGNATLIALLNMIPFAGSGAYSRIITLVLMVAIIFSAFGTMFFVRDLKDCKYRWAVLALAVMLGWLALAKLGHYDSLSIREFLPWLAGLAGFIAAAGLLVRFGRAGLVLPLAIALVIVDLKLAGYDFNTRLDADKHFPENTIIKRIKAQPGDFRTALLMSHTGYHHNILSYYELSTIGGYSTIAPNDFLYFIRHAYKNVKLTLNGILFLFDGNLDVLRLLNARFIISNLPLVSDLITPVYSNEAETLYEFKRPLERVYCASHQIVNPDALQIPGQLAEIASRYDRPVIVTEALVDGKKLTRNCEVAELHVYTSKIEFKVDTDKASLVVIPTNYHQYWRASLNEQDLDIHKADYTFMTLVIPAGTNTVKLEFINHKQTLGAVLFIILGIITIGVALLRVQSGWQKTIFMFLAVLLIGKSLMSIPGVMNTDIPERGFTDNAGPDPDGES